MDSVNSPSFFRIHLSLPMLPASCRTYSKCLTARNNASQSSLVAPSWTPHAPSPTFKTCSPVSPCNLILMVSTRRFSRHSFRALFSFLVLGRRSRFSSGCPARRVLGSRHLLYPQYRPPCSSGYEAFTTRYDLEIKRKRCHVVPFCFLLLRLRYLPCLVLRKSCDYCSK